MVKRVKFMACVFYDNNKSSSAPGPGGCVPLRRAGRGCSRGPASGCPLHTAQVTFVTSFRPDGRMLPSVPCPHTRLIAHLLSGGATLIWPDPELRPSLPHPPLGKAQRGCGCRVLSPQRAVKV